MSDPNVALMSAPLVCGEVEEREGEGETMMNTASVSWMSLTDLITALSPLSPVMLTVDVNVVLSFSPSCSPLLRMTVSVFI